MMAITNVPSSCSKRWNRVIPSAAMPNRRNWIVAYAYYKDNEPISAIAACDRFIKLHPNHPNVDYAYYLKGLANFNDDLGLLGNLVEQDMSERDPGPRAMLF